MESISVIVLIQIDDIEKDGCSRPFIKYKT